LVAFDISYQIVHTNLVYIEANVGLIINGEVNEEEYPVELDIVQTHHHVVFLGADVSYLAGEFHI
jgi:hypothetical protein